MLEIEQLVQLFQVWFLCTRPIGLRRLEGIGVLMLMLWESCWRLRQQIMANKTYYCQNRHSQWRYMTRLVKYLCVRKSNSHIIGNKSHETTYWKLLVELSVSSHQELLELRWPPYLTANLPSRKIEIKLRKKQKRRAKRQLLTNLIRIGAMFKAINARQPFWVKFPEFEPEEHRFPTNLRNSLKVRLGHRIFRTQLYSIESAQLSYKDIQYSKLQKSSIPNWIWLRFNQSRDLLDGPKGSHHLASII